MTTPVGLSAQTSSEQFQLELQRVVRQHERTQDAARRTWPAFLSTFFSNVGLAAATMFPGSASVFGNVKPAEAAISVAPALTMWTLCFVLYRVRGPESPLYQRLVNVELLTLIGFLAGLIYFAESVFSVAWSAMPVSAAYWSTLRPHRNIENAAIASVAHAGLLVHFLLHGSVGDAVFVALAWAGFLAALAVAGRAATRAMRLEAESNIARYRLEQAQQLAQQSALDSTLSTKIGEPLNQLIERLAVLNALPTDGGVPFVEHAHDALAELERTVQGLGAQDAPATRLALADTILRKCRALLPVGFELRANYGAKGSSASVNPSLSLATLRVAREFTRNAVAHGDARRVLVTLEFGESELKMRVEDDGSGLIADAWPHATGGLQNARVWAAMLDGTVGMLSAGDGAAGRTWATRLEWRVPLLD